MKNLSIKLNFIFFFAIVYLLYRYEYVQEQDTNQVISFIDSIDKANDTYFEKIDSLEHIKHEEYRIYEKITLKYDTIQIAIPELRKACKCLLNGKLCRNAGTSFRV